jgi:hypothetical protein
MQSGIEILGEWMVLFQLQTHDFIPFPLNPINMEHNLQSLLELSRKTNHNAGVRNQSHPPILKKGFSGRYHPSSLEIFILDAFQSSPIIPDIRANCFDEDQFGRAYEQGLAVVRKQEGIFYSHPEVPKYILSRTIDRDLTNIIEQITDALNRRDITRTLDLYRDFTQYSILDPACGAGTFLVKALRIIYAKTLILSETFESYLGLDAPTFPIKDLSRKLKGQLNFPGINDLILDHIHGVDKDPTAIEITKTVLAMEMIRLAVQTSKNRSTHATQLPGIAYLGFNIQCGDALCGNSALQMTLKIHSVLQQTIPEINSLWQQYRQEIRQMSPNVEVISKIQSRHDRLNSPDQFDWPTRFWTRFFDTPGLIRTPEQRGWNCIVGNPPYENAKLITDSKSYFRRRFRTTYGAGDLYILFLELTLELLRPNGILGMITSNKYFIADYGIKIREILLQQQILALVDLTEMPAAFYDAMISTAIIIARKKTELPPHHQKNGPQYTDKQEDAEFETENAPAAINQFFSEETLQNHDLNHDQVQIVIFHKNDPTMLSRIESNEANPNYSIEFRPQAQLPGQFSNHFNIYITAPIRRILAKCYKNSPLCRDPHAKVRTGMMGFDYHHVEPLITEMEADFGRNIDPGQLRSDRLRLLLNSNVDQFRFLWGKKKVQIYKNSFLNPIIRDDPTKINRSTWDFFCQPKVIVRGVARKVTAAYDSTGSALLVAVHAIQSDRWTPQYLVALFNSVLFNWLHRLTYYSARIPQGSLRYPISFITSLPIRDPDPKTIQELEHLVELLEKPETSNFITLLVALNQIIFSLYNLDKQEIQLILSTPGLFGSEKDLRLHDELVQWINSDEKLEKNKFER